MDRRAFLKAAASVGGFSLVPRISVAESMRASSGKNLVVINLFGGCDGLSMVPYYQGAVVDQIAGYRNALRVAPANAIDVGGQNGLPYRIGLHPALSNLASTAAGNIALIQRYGLINESGRSHDTCQLLVSLGADGTEYDQGRGFLARLMDNQRWESLQYWGLSGNLLPDFNARERKPIVVDDISEFGTAALSSENVGDAQQVAETVAALYRSETDLVGIRGRYARTAARVHQQIDIVQREIASQTVATFTGDIGRSLADATRILAAKKNSLVLGHQAKSTVVYLGMGGYDTHSDQGAATLLEDGLGWSFASLGNNLATFVQELKRLGAWQDTAIVVISEFGRTVRQNGIGGATVGTDHGWGSNTFVIGGGIRHGVYGEPPSSSELADEDTDALLVTLDYRDIFSDVFQWMGEPTTGVFPATYIPRLLGLFT